MGMSERIDSVRACIKALGGPKKAAQFMRVGPTQISNMLRDGAITSGHHMKVYFRLKNAGFELDPAAVFGLDEDGEPISDQDV